MKKLLGLVRSLPEGESKFYLYQDCGSWVMDNAFLLPKGYSFVTFGNSAKDVCDQMQKRLNALAKMDDPAGKVLREMGWPDLNKVREFVK